MRLILTGILFLSLAAVGDSKPITFIHQGSGSGSLNGVAFAITPFVITALGDTSNRVDFGSSIFAITHHSARIELVGIGIFDLSTMTRSWVAQQIQRVGLERATGSGADLVDGPDNTTFAEFASWDMTTSIGPSYGSVSTVRWGSPFSEVNTSGGVLVFSDGTHAGAFTAIVTPEPSSLCLCIGSIVLLGIRRRKSFALFRDSSSSFSNSNVQNVTSP
jgi:hypothetical protein